MQMHAFALGVRGVTHLFNAMTPLTGREPGAVCAALDHRDSWCGIIVDGHHVHAASLRTAIRAKPRGRMFLVTDAMPPVGGERDEFLLAGQRVLVRDGLCVNEQGALAGSALDMLSAVRNTVEQLELPLEEAVRMASTWPAEFLGLGASHGRRKPIISRAGTPGWLTYGGTKLILAVYCHLSQALGQTVWFGRSAGQNRPRGHVRPT
jgi:N-acetylglucosamine-6-phosphate deacetylase